MTSTFKLTKAEFKKIFKRPSIFIMAVLLVVTMLVSITIFKPAELVNPTIEYTEATNSEEYYNYFNNPINLNSKATFDEVYSNTDSIISYFDAVNANANLLSNYYNNVIETMNLLVADNLTETKDNYREEALKDVNNFLNAYKSLDSVKAYTKITGPILKDYTYTIEDKSSKELKSVPTNYYTTKGCEKLIMLQTYLADTSKYNSKVVAETYVNNYEAELTKVLNNGINFIYTSIKGFANQYNDFFATFSTASGRSDIALLKAMKNNMLQLLNTLDDYLETLIDYEFPVIIMDKTVYEDLKSRIEESIVALTISPMYENSLDKYTEIKASLSNIKLDGALNIATQDSTSTDSSYIIQTKMTISDVNEYKALQTKVNTNKETILASIKELSTDESITNISKSITDYSLLSKAYNGIILDKVLLSIADKYDTSVYTKFYGHNFDEFNKYQTREAITINDYYIQNNTYSNSYLNQFAYNQNSGTKTNVYDYMYFTLELCTLILIVFSMMLVCNLITGETESGTIKLLLVRPFKRSKIITAKLLATIFFVITFMFFSSVITFIGGYFLYGPATTNVLAVFNSGAPFEISPLLLMLINIISLTFDVIFFVLLALMISILCKNFAASISCSLVLLILNYALNIIFGGAFWYTLLPGMNLHLFKFFGNSFASIIEGTTGFAGLIQSLLITGIETTMTFWYSFGMSCAYCLVFLVISYSVFQKRDF